MNRFASKPRWWSILLAWALLFNEMAYGESPPAPASQAEFKSLASSLLPAPKNGGFAMDGWTKYSECVRATSSTWWANNQYNLLVNG